MPHEPLQSDEAHLAELGRRLAQVRIEKNLTQAELAFQAGVGKRTLERLEAGRSIQLAGFLRILRVLDLIDGLERLVPEIGPSPMDLLRRQGKQRRRASRRDSRPPGIAEPFTWGDES
jgi:transcriptional regulator with XRE-family HTH domain